VLGRFHKFGPALAVVAHGKPKLLGYRYNHILLQRGGHCKMTDHDPQPIIGIIGMGDVSPALSAVSNIVDALTKRWARCTLAVSQQVVYASLSALSALSPPCLISI
jgi:hypothetical protein